MSSAEAKLSELLTDFTKSPELLGALQKKIKENREECNYFMFNELAEWEEWDAVKCLLEAGMEVDSPKYYGSRNSPRLLHIAVEKGSLEMVRFLLGEGAGFLDDYDDFTRPPLSTAFDFGHLLIANELVNAEGINLNVIDDKMYGNGNSPLHYAAMCSTVSEEVDGEEIFLTDIVKKMVEKGADANLRNKKGNTPLHIAVHKEQNEIVKTLIESEGVDLNPQNKKGDTPLHFASRKYYDGCGLYSLLRRGGASEFVVNNKGVSPIGSKAWMMHSDEEQDPYSDDV
tara:strand:- start:1271 stop:2125 length:855 start_codon:yes stop_codon:yes gene_type:complete